MTDNDDVKNGNNTQDRADGDTSSSTYHAPKKASGSPGPEASNKKIKCRYCGEMISKDNPEQHWNIEHCKGLMLDNMNSKFAIHPSYDFHNGVLYVTESYINQIGKRVTFLFDSKGFEYLLLDDNTSNKDWDFVLKSKPMISVESRWGLDSARAFRHEQDKEVSINDAYQKVKKTLNSLYDFQDERNLKMISLWVVGTYFYPVFSAYPYLYFSAMKDAGKTKMLQILEQLCFKACLWVSPSDSAFFRFAGQERGTLLFDELKRQHERTMSDLESLLKVRYKKGGKVPRMDKDESGKLVMMQFDVYGPTAIANLVGLPDDVMDRCIQICLSKAKDQVKANSEPDQYTGWQGIRDMLFTCAMQNANKINQSIPLFENGLTDLRERGNVGEGCLFIFNYIKGMILTREDKENPDKLFNPMDSVPPGSHLPLISRDIELSKGLAILSSFVQEEDSKDIQTFLVDYFMSKRESRITESQDMIILRSAASLVFDDVKELSGKKITVTSDAIRLRWLKEDPDNSIFQDPTKVSVKQLNTIIGLTLGRFGIGKGQVFERRKKVHGINEFELNLDRFREYVERNIPDYVIPIPQSQQKTSSNVPPKSSDVMGEGGNVGDA